MARHVVGLFPDRDAAEHAMVDLKAAGFNPDRMGVVMRDKREAQEVAEEHGLTSTASAVTGSIIGGGIGTVLAATGTFVIPGIGPFISGGILATALAGGAAGWLIGGLAGLGIPREEAQYYQGRVEQGGVLVTVDPEGRDAEVRQILLRDGAEDMQARGAAGTTGTTPTTTPTTTATTNATTSAMAMPPGSPMPQRSAPMESDNTDLRDRNLDGLDESNRDDTLRRDAMSGGRTDARAGARTGDDRADAMAGARTGEDRTDNVLVNDQPLPPNSERVIGGDDRTSTARPIDRAADGLAGDATGADGDIQMDPAAERSIPMTDQDIIAQGNAERDRRQIQSDQP